MPRRRQSTGMRDVTDSAEDDSNGISQRGPKIFTALSPHQVQDALQVVGLREHVYQVRLLYAVTGG